MAPCGAPSLGTSGCHLHSERVHCDPAGPAVSSRRRPRGRDALAWHLRDGPSGARGGPGAEPPRTRGLCWRAGCVPSARAAGAGGPTERLLSTPAPRPRRGRGCSQGLLGPRRRLGWGQEQHDSHKCSMPKVLLGSARTPVRRYKQSKGEPTTLAQETAGKPGDSDPGRWAGALLCAVRSLRWACEAPSSGSSCPHPHG